MIFRIVSEMMLTLLLINMLTVTPTVTSTDQSTHDFLIGASYMTFWGTGMDIDWFSGAVYWPILGNYSSNNETIADQHIKWALQHGIDFFYLDYGWAVGSDREKMENATVQGLLKAKSIENFSFCTNYFPYNVVLKVAEPDTYDINETAITEVFSHLNETYFSHSSYLRLDNKRVVTLVDFPKYFADMNQSTASTFIGKMNSIFSGLKETYDLFLIFAFWPYVKHEYVNATIGNPARVYDAITLWGNTTIIEFNKTISYLEYVNKTRNNFRNWSSIAGEFEVNFVPLICPGYNNMIYAYMNKTSWWAIVTRDPEGFREVCQLVKNYSSSPYNMILLFGWNDFKEGTSIEPTTDYGDTYLSIVRTIPEFPSIRALPLLMIATLLAVIVYRRKHSM